MCRVYISSVAIIRISLCAAKKRGLEESLKCWKCGAGLAGEYLLDFYYFFLV